MRYVPVLLLAAFSAMAVAPMFHNSTRLMASDTLISVHFGKTSPCFEDWNGDGKPDLLLGHCYPSGNIRFFDNVCTGTTPEFIGFEYLYADGSRLSVAYD